MMVYDGVPMYDFVCFGVWWSVMLYAGVYECVGV